MARNWAAAPSRSTWPSRAKNVRVAAVAVVVDTAAAVASATDPFRISGRGSVKAGSRLFIFQFRVDTLGQMGRGHGVFTDLLNEGGSFTKKRQGAIQTTIC